MVIFSEWSNVVIFEKFEVDVECGVIIEEWCVYQDVKWRTSQVRRFFLLVNICNLDCEFIGLMDIVVMVILV